MEGRKRTVQVKFYVTEEERRLIREKMKLIPTRNMAAYLRKMAIDGYVVHSGRISRTISHCLLMLFIHPFLNF